MIINTDTKNIELKSNELKLFIQVLDVIKGLEDIGDYTIHIPEESNIDLDYSNSSVAYH